MRQSIPIAPGRVEKKATEHSWRETGGPGGKKVAFTKFHTAAL
jgi:hypothetical protein